MKITTANVIGPTDHYPITGTSLSIRRHSIKTPASPSRSSAKAILQDFIAATPPPETALAILAAGFALGCILAH